MNIIRTSAVPFACALALISMAATAADFITGTVRSGGQSPEAGVWVIAETADLPTPYRKIVVTDEAGRFALPELPAAKYKVWVRGYGLADSRPVEAAPGATLELAAVVAADPQEAALVYPASAWFSLFSPPPAAAFGGKSESAAAAGLFAAPGAGPSEDPFKTPAAWFAQMKLNCVLCHQLGSAPTRLGEATAFDHGFLKAGGMNYFAEVLGRRRLTAALGEWGRHIGAGATPAAPPRPQGLERNIVITQWAWGDSHTYAHDEVATDKRNPRVNAGGPVYGVDLANDYLLVVDPRSHTAERIKVPTRDGFDTPWGAQTYKPLAGGAPQPFGFGSLGDPWPGGQSSAPGAYNNPANPHNPMMDGAGRV